ncbi:MAG: membrane protein insertion efficiency factor YidD [Oligoflexia bacterium]
MEKEMNSPSFRARLAHYLWRVYRVILFPFLLALSGGGGAHQGCRHYPSCSEFALAQVSRNGWIRGGFAGLKRIFTCHPFARPVVVDRATNEK